MPSAKTQCKNMQITHARKMQVQMLSSHFLSHFFLLFPFFFPKSCLSSWSLIWFAFVLHVFSISHVCFFQSCIFQFLFFALVLFASPGLAFFNPLFLAWCLHLFQAVNMLEQAQFDSTRRHLACKSPAAARITHPYVRDSSYLMIVVFV